MSFCIDLSNHPFKNLMASSFLIVLDLDVLGMSPFRIGIEKSTDNPANSPINALQLLTREMVSLFRFLSTKKCNTISRPSSSE